MKSVLDTALVYLSVLTVLVVMAIAIGGLIILPSVLQALWQWAIP